MVDPNEAREALAEVRGIRKAADHLRLMQNGGGSGKGLVWGLLDWADEMEKKTSAALVDAQKPTADDREALARECYRWLYPGSVNTPDSNRTRQSDAAEQDRAYRTWDEGKEGYAPGAICRELADRILAAGFRRPEPVPDTDEWEYGRRYSEMDGSTRVRKVPAADILEHRPDGHRADGSPYWNYTQVRRRKAGPWEPVEVPDE